MKATSYGAVALLAGLAGCAMPGPYDSWAGGIQPTDAPLIASDLTDYLATAVPAGRATISVANPTTQQASLVEPVFETALRRRGFAVAPPGPPPPGAYVVRYLISPSDLGLSVRLDAGSAEATRLYGRSPEGRLTPLGPFVVRQ